MEEERMAEFMRMRGIDNLEEFFPYYE